MSSRVARAQCANCTCSPGLISRANRKSIYKDSVLIEEIQHQEAEVDALQEKGLFSLLILPCVYLMPKRLIPPRD